MEGGSLVVPERACRRQQPAIGSTAALRRRARSLAPRVDSPPSRRPRRKSAWTHAVADAGRAGSSAHQRGRKKEGRPPFPTKQETKSRTGTNFFRWSGRPQTAQICCVASLPAAAAAAAAALAACRPPPPPCCQLKTFYLSPPASAALPEAGNEKAAHAREAPPLGRAAQSCVANGLSLPHLASSSPSFHLSAPLSIYARRRRASDVRDREGRPPLASRGLPAALAS